MSQPTNDLIYLDYNATTPMAEPVIEAMSEALRATWGNASSAHAIGAHAKDALDRARAKVAALIGSQPDEIVFTSGGTESDNAAVLGVAYAREPVGRHIVTSVVEHGAVGKACTELEARGWEITRIGVDANCRVNADEFVEALRKDTAIATLIHAQNETGVIQPVEVVARACRERGIPFHTDAAQSVGKLSTRVNDFGCDLLTIAGHKLYGPKGVGALYIRRGTPFQSLLVGAGHELGRRAGTENVPAIIGLGAACALAQEELGERTAHLGETRDRIEAGLRERIPELVVHGERVLRLPNTLSAAIPGVDAVELFSRVDGVASSAGAACHSGKRHVSPVLKAMGVAEDLALATMRLTVGCPTTLEDADRAVERILAAAEPLRAAS